VSLAPVLALAALVPVLVGPLPTESATLRGSICGGGDITIPLGKGREDKPECHPKGCHAGTCRERSKRVI
jgi:hypothetical protein